MQRGKALYDAGKFSEAIRVLQQEAQNYRSRGDRLGQAIALSNLSLAYQQLGQWSEATQAIESSLKLLQEPQKAGNADQSASQTLSAKSQRQQVFAQALEVQGHLQLALGQTEQALSTWQQVGAVYTQLGDKNSKTRSRIYEAQTLQALGFYRRAKEILVELEPTLAKQPDSLDKALGFRLLGEVRQAVGELSEAEVALKISFGIAERMRSLIEMGATRLSQGNTARAQQKSQAAIAFYEQAVKLSPLPLTQVQAKLNQLSLFVADKQWSAVKSLARQLRPQLDRLPPSQAAVYARINFVQSLMKLTDAGGMQPEESASFFREAAELLSIGVRQARSLNDPRVEAYAIGSLGSVYEKTGQWAEAQDLTQQALLLSQQLNAPEIAYRWQWQLGRLLRRQGQMEGAIAAYNTTVNTLQSLRSDLVVAKQDVQFSFRDSVEPIYRETVDLLLASPPQNNQPDRLIKARELIEALQLAELDNFFREACLSGQITLLDQVVEKSTARSAVLYPIILPDRLDIIVKLPQEKELRYHSIPALSQETVQKTVTQLRRTLVSPSEMRSMQSLSRQVYSWLIEWAEPALRQNQVDTLVFVLDGELRNIPMAALYDGEKYLIEKYAIALSPGLQLLAPKPINRGALKALTAGLINPPESFKEYPPLPGIQSEFNAIVQAGVSTRRLLNQEFTNNALKREINAAPFNVVHLATHGQFSSQLEKTFILAASGPIKVNELGELLRSRDQTRPEAVELLVLSACQTAAGDNRATLGLAGVAIRSGARSTVASLWNVEDQPTANFIGEFYKELKNSKVTKAEALRRAQMTLLNQNRRYAGYWAPYVLVGNWL